MRTAPRGWEHVDAVEHQLFTADGAELTEIHGFNHVHGFVLQGGWLQVQDPAVGIVWNAYESTDVASG